MADLIGGNHIRVMVLGTGQSYMLNSIISQLETGNIEGVFSEAKVDAVGRLGKRFNGILIYADEQLADEQQLQVYIKDLAMEEDIPVFLMGYPDEINKITETIPSILISKTFERPINVGQMTQEIEEFYLTHRCAKKKKILVVDDSGAALRMIKGWLDQKYQIILANSGMMAIKYLTQDNPDLILLDYEMPVCDGKMVLEMIRAESDYSNVPVIFLTAKGDRESIMKVMSLKPEGYLLKTMDPKDIVKSIDEFFERRKGK